MEVHYGKGIKPPHAQALMTRYNLFVEGEDVWFFGKCNNMRPMVDRLVITNLRVMALSSTRGYKFMAPIPQIRSAAYDQGKGQVELTTTDGNVTTFKMVPSEDVPVVEHFLRYALEHPASEEAMVALAERGALGSTVLAAEGDTKADHKAAAKAHKTEVKQLEAERRAAEDRAEREITGAATESASFGGKTVTIYRNGYVRVSGLFSKAAAERLVSIEASDQVSKKSGLGRGVGAVATGGLNLLSSNKRGDVWLTIVTESNTHVLHAEPPNAMNIKASKKLEAAGNAVIHAAHLNDAPQPQEAPPVPGLQTGPSAADRLRELGVMRDEGLITAVEYDALRTKLLDSL